MSRSALVVYNLLIVIRAVLDALETRRVQAQVLLQPFDLLIQRSETLIFKN